MTSTGPKLFFLAFLTLSACSVPDTPGDVHDPYEPVNRVSHAFNKGTDAVVLRPVSRVYGTVIPQPVRTGLSNAASNLDTPRSAVNDVLQGDIEDAVHNSFRFLINTTVGILGLFDPASRIGLDERNTGFGDTLAVWGAPEGAYLELPLLGPSNERDAVGQVVDIIANPISLAFPGTGDDVAAATRFPSILNSRFEFSDTFDSILYESADSYAQLRLFFIESRRFELNGQGAGEDVFDPFENLYDGVFDDF